MSEDIRYDERVVVITGAGGGIGRQYAQDFGKRGARVIANDLGTALDGTPLKESPVVKVVEEIRRAGGQAVADNNNIITAEGARALMRVALDSYGRVDVLINNAGITRNNLIENMSSEDFKAVLDVHLFGAFECTRAVWPTMQGQRYGRVLMTTSQSGLYGMPTHANYASAKAGLFGLAHALSLEGRVHGIQVNTICPMATTRMSEPFLTEEMKVRMRPSSVSAMAMWLCSEQCSLTDQVVEAGMGYFAKIQVRESTGIVIDPSIASPEYLREHYSEIEDMSKSGAFDSVEDFLGKIGKRVYGS